MPYYRLQYSLKERGTASWAADVMDSSPNRDLINAYQAVQFTDKEQRPISQEI